MKPNLRLLIVQANLVLVTLLITFLRFFSNDNEALSSIYVWYIWLSNSTLNVFLLRNKDIFSPQHIFSVAYVLLLTSQDIFALPGLNFPKQDTYFLIISGLAMFLIGSMHGGVPSLDKIGNLRGLIKIKRHNYIILIAVMFMVTLFGIVGFAIQAKLPIFSADVENYRFEVRDRIFLFGPIWYFCLTATLASLWSMFASFVTQNRTEKIIYSVAGILAILTLLLWGIRGRVVDAILILVILYHYTEKKVSAWGLVLIGVSGLFLITISGMARLQIAGDISPEASLLRAVHELQINSSNLQLLVDTYPAKVDFGYGLNMLYPFYTLLPGHQEGFAEQLKAKLDLDFEGGGITPTILGEPYMDFGPIGVIVVLLLFGKIVGTIYRKVGTSKVATLLYPIIIVAAIEFIRTGGIINFLDAYYIIFSLWLFRYGVQDIKSEYRHLLFFKVKPNG